MLESQALPRSHWITESQIAGLLAFSSGELVGANPHLSNGEQVRRRVLFLCEARTLRVPYKAHRMFTRILMRLRLVFCFSPTTRGFAMLEQNSHPHFSLLYTSAVLVSVAAGCGEATPGAVSTQPLYQTYDTHDTSSRLKAVGRQSQSASLVYLGAPTRRHTVSG